MRWNSRFEPLPCVAVLALWLTLAAVASAQAPATPEQVVRRHAQAWSEGDVAGLLALFDEDARSYDRSRDPLRLAGARSQAIGSKAQLADYFSRAVRSPLARETVEHIAVVGDLAIAAGYSAQPPDYSQRMRFLTAFRIRDGRIHDLWHIAWLPEQAPAQPDPSRTVRALIEANNARDADRFLSLFDPQARNFRHSADPRQLAEQPSKTLVDAASRERYFRKYFAGTPVQVRAVALFSVGDLVVEQSHVSGFADAPGKRVNEVSIYRIRDGRIVGDWLLAEETLPAAVQGAQP
ncbi:nuclear transport factor 2 family protein [Lysobacter silvisoli]|nr:nuclear transport factor 2 family protein [Lysobacter silvisoli]